jgi:hypothetical protein
VGRWLVANGDLGSKGTPQRHHDGSLASGRWEVLTLLMRGEMSRMRSVAILPGLTGLT